jgi:chromosome segregation ATPase
MLQDNPYALKRGITVSREPSAPSAPPAQDGGDDDVLELRAALKLAYGVLERYRSQLERYRSDLKQKEDELKQQKEWYTQLNDDFEFLHRHLAESKEREDQLKQKQHEPMGKNTRLQDEVKYLQKHVDERTTELAKLEEENVSLRYELFNTKAEVEKLQERMRS